MKNKDIINKILAYHPQLPNYNGCDGYKAGNPEDECGGVAVALVPTYDVIKRASEMGCNLLVTHETIYYQTPDFPVWRGRFLNSVQRNKEQMIKDSGICIWRDHDHMHAHQPDSIFSSIVKSLGWEQYRVNVSEDTPYLYLFDLPETTVEGLGDYLIDAIGLRGLRYIGNGDEKISRVAFVAHIYPDSFITDGINEDGYYDDYAMRIMEMMEKYDIHVLIPGEIIDWTALAYIRDAADMGRKRVCINLGHFNWEELGMKDFANIIADLVDHNVPVHYLPTGDQWHFIKR